MKSIAIVIPVYKEFMTEAEKIAFVQCLRVLKERDVVLVAPKQLNISSYIKYAVSCGVKLNVKLFSKSYFEGIAGYNRLMQSLLFYQSFCDYAYVLIYQLDAYIFRDELDIWMGKEYDYVAAPWFEDYGTYEDGKKLWKVGNGGFSLRRVEFFIQQIKKKKWLSYRRLCEYYSPSTFWDHLYMLFRAFSGYKNNFNFWQKQAGMNEDFFWSVFMQTIGMSVRIPSPLQAVAFAFEKSPTYLFRINGNRLPMGCHAWMKYEYDSFWKNYMLCNRNH